MRKDIANGLGGAAGAAALVKHRRIEHAQRIVQMVGALCGGVKRIRKAADRTGREVIIIALTANAVSGAKAMFIKEGFDGFLAKPIDHREFERVMKNVLSPDQISYREDKT